MGGYSMPIGGKSRIVIPGITIHSAAFTRVGIWHIGARTTVISLAGENKPLAVYCPMPWGSEMESMLQLAGSENVKYIVAGDGEHYLGIPSWTAQFPSAKVVAMDVLVASLKAKNSQVNIVIGETDGDKRLSGEDLAKIGFEKDFTDALDVFYMPNYANKEIVLYHKSSETLIEADVVFNLPAHEQYESASFSYNSGVSRFFQSAHPGGWLGNFLSKNVAKGKSVETLKIILNLPIKRVIPCHGDIMEGEPAVALKKIWGIE